MLVIFLLQFLFLWSSVDAQSLNSSAETFPHYKVVTVADGFVVQNNTGNISRPFQGPFIEMLDFVAKGMNFTYDITAQPDNEYGNNRGPGGKWNGMMGSLIDDKADLAVGSFLGTAECGAVATFARIPYNLTVSVFVNPVFGIKDINYLVDSKLNAYILSKSMNPRAQEIWAVLKKQNLNDSVVSDEVAIEKVANGKFGYVKAEDSVDKLVAASKGKLFRIPTAVNTGVSLAPFAVKKDSSKMRMVIDQISDLLELTASFMELEEAFKV